jgi:isopenicillin N synthase-like dioxygenase
LELEHPEDLVDWHSRAQNSAMRLLHYPPANAQTGNRCKEHSDYGSLTLLNTDGVSGLEILLDGKWWPVPHVPGTIVVNIGSLLSDWTDQRLLATLHRVAGPASEHSASNPENLLKAVSRGRTSIAIFVDPDEGAPILRGGTIKEYISWRSGGDGPKRSGVAFTSNEQERLQE